MSKRTHPPLRSYAEAIEEARHVSGHGLTQAMLDDAEREVLAHVAARRPRPHVLAWTLGLTLVPAAAAAVWLVVMPWIQRGIPATVQELGSVHIAMVSGSAASDIAAMTTAGHTKALDVAEGGVAHLALGDAVRLVATGPARLELNATEPPRLLDGSLAVSVRRRSARHPVAIRAGEATVLVHGTRFAVLVQQGTLRDVYVEEGRVEVRDSTALRGRSRVLDPGDAFIEASGRQPLAALFEAPWWQGAFESAEAGGAVQITSEPPAAQVQLDGRVAGRAPVHARLISGKHVAMVSAPGHETVEVPFVIEAGATQKLEIVLATTPPVPKRGAAPEPVARKPDPWRLARAALARGDCSEIERQGRKLMANGESRDTVARVRMRVAECHLGHGDKKQALRVYQQVARDLGGTSSAEVALFECAKLLTELGQRREARRVVAEYLRAHPTGRFASEAAFRQCELTIDARELPVAQTCLRNFLAQHATSPRQSDAVLLLATIARVGERWAEAAELYQRYFDGHPPTERAEEALYHRIQCLRRGKLPGLDAALAAYRRAYPNGAHAKEIEALMP